MRIFIDLDSLKLISSATDRRAIARIEGKRGDYTPIELRFVRDGSPVRLATDTAITFAVKKDGKFDGDLVTFANTFEASATFSPTPDSDPHYTGALSLSTAELNEIFATDADPDNDLRLVDLMAEITWKAPDDDGPTSSQTFQLRVANDVHRGDESSPVYIPNYGQGTPVAPVVATATTSMAGANNDWDLAATVAGAAANAYSLSVAVETGKADGPDVSIVGTDVVVTAGDKAIMVVTGTLTDGTDPVVFPPLEYFETDPRPRYEGESVSIAYDDNDNKWRMVYFNDYTSITSYWESSNNVATPDLVTTWTPVSPATGTPTVTALAHTAAQCKAAFDATTANETLFTLTNKSGNDGTGSVTTAGPITLSGGIEGTASTPGLMLYDENFLYIATNGNGATDPATWRKIAHSAL